ncbi:MAG TPA: molybdopterin-guanine dinucleotide biosynthesis protein B [Chromatiales bacterium]|nr:molybdopterin-guanine dinucleotide biosynthesis protein B [Chromatiales bacterium]
MLRNAKVPVLGIAAYSGTGKTTLLRSVLPELRARGLRVGLVKHAHHKFEIDHPGKDSYRLRKAGANRVLVASAKLRALVEETDLAGDPRLDDLLAGLPQDDLDLILVEGFKHERFPKIELHRPALGKPLLFPKDPCVIAVATDAPLPVTCTLPVLDLNAPGAVSAFILDFRERSLESGAPLAAPYRDSGPFRSSAG